MTLKTLGPMLGEIHAMFQAKGCTVTEVSVIFHPPQDEGTLACGEQPMWFDHAPDPSAKKTPS